MGKGKKAVILDWKEKHKLNPLFPWQICKKKSKWAKKGQKKDLKMLFLLKILHRFSTCPLPVIFAKTQVFMNNNPVKKSGDKEITIEVDSTAENLFWIV